MTDYPEDFATVTIPFTTNDATGAPVAPSSAFTTADFKIYKNGSATEKTTANGLTVTSPFDSVVGSHMLAIDTSVDTGDSNFWVAGAVYDVKLDTAKTVDGKTVSRWIGQFTLGMARAETAASLLASWTTALTESYSTDGAAPTPAQILFLLLAHHNESSISGTTKTVKKLDGSTTAATFTLNDATTPTAITRAT